tara:strand:- start:14 stop:493 length:480 start_codon:yes stop_codon:yes gene_type:complete
MANISTYPIATPGASDLVPGTVLFTDENGKTHNLTKNFTVASINNLAPTSVAGDKAYIAQWTQSGTNAPVPVEIYNNTGAKFTWARVSTGSYSITADSAVFTANKTFFNLQGTGTAASAQFLEPTSISNGNLAKYRQIAAATGALQDGNEGWLEIRIYS